MRIAISLAIDMTMARPATVGSTNVNFSLASNSMYIAVISAFA